LTFFSFCFVLFCFMQYWGLNSGPKPQATPPALVLWRVSPDRVFQTICPGWLQTLVLLISVSWIAGITGMSHQHPAWNSYYCLWPYIWDMKFDAMMHGNSVRLKVGTKMMCYVYSKLRTPPQPQEITLPVEHRTCFDYRKQVYSKKQ
jgi:hypothetical protein